MNIESLDFDKLTKWLQIACKEHKNKIFVMSSIKAYLNKYELIEVDSDAVFNILIEVEAITEKDGIILLNVD